MYEMNILKKIEALRNLLNEKAKISLKLTTEEIIHLSEQFDLLIDEYYQQLQYTKKN